MKLRTTLLPLVIGIFASTPMVANAAIVEQIGSFGNWPTVWTAIPGLNDPAGEQIDVGAVITVPGRVDFVGNATDPAGYYASQNGYLFFRMRTNTTTVTGSYYNIPLADPPTENTSRTYKDSMAIMIDVVGSHIDTTTGKLLSGETDVQARRPDYGFRACLKTNLLISNFKNRKIAGFYTNFQSH